MTKATGNHLMKSISLEKPEPCLVSGNLKVEYAMEFHINTYKQLIRNATEICLMKSCKPVCAQQDYSFSYTITFQKVFYTRKLHIFTQSQVIIPSVSPVLSNSLFPDLLHLHSDRSSAFLNLTFLFSFDLSTERVLQLHYRFVHILYFRYNLVVMQFINQRINLLVEHTRLLLCLCFPFVRIQRDLYLASRWMG